LPLPLFPLKDAGVLKRLVHRQDWKNQPRPQLLLGRSRISTLS
jgi:hypothetical protein